MTQLVGPGVPEFLVRGVLRGVLITPLPDLWRGGLRGCQQATGVSRKRWQSGFLQGRLIMDAARWSIKPARPFCGKFGRRPRAELTEALAAWVCRGRPG